MSAINGIRFEIACGYRAGGKDGMAPDRYTGADNGFGAYPGAVFEGYGAGYKVKSRAFVVVIAAKE